MATFRSAGKQTIKSKIKNLTENFTQPKKKRLISAIERANPRGQSSAMSDLFKQNAFQLEQLEPRLLLSADPLAAAFAASADVTLMVMTDAASQQYIQLIDNSDSTVLGQRKISDIAAGDIITITGSAGNDKLTVDKSFLDLGEQAYVVQFDGAGGDDTVALSADVEQSSWQISGDYEGSLGDNGSVEFISVEEIQANNASDESSHVLSAINDSYQWLIQQDNQGVLATLETQQYNELQSANNTGIKFSGFDTLAGSGTDQLNYSQYASGVTVDLETGTATGFTQVAGINTIVGSDQDDVLAGDTNDNNFVVDFGDTVIGAGGYDTLIYREQGTAGIDVKLNVVVAESDFILQSGNWDGTDFTDGSGIITANDVDFLSAFGGSGDNYFDFSSSDLQLHLDGGAGDDHLIGGSLDDLLTGGSGADIIDGRGHVDGDELVELRVADFTVVGDTLKVGNDGLDTLINIENLYLRAFTEDTDTVGKTLDASAANEYNITLTGSELNDTLIASDWGDTLVGLSGADTITAGAGVDTFSEDFAGRAIFSSTGGSNYSVDLAQGVNEKWQLTRPSSTSGAGFVLTITTLSAPSTPVVTEEIYWTSTAAQVATAIEKALGLDFGHLSVQLNGDVWDVEFVGLYAAQQMATTITVTNGATASLAQAGSTDQDTLIGFSTNDIIELRGSFAADLVDVSDYTGLTLIDTYAGQDTIKAGSGINTIDAGDGDDVIYLQGKSADIIEAGSGSDRLVVDLSADTGNSHSINLDNNQLVVDTYTVTIGGLESVDMLGSILVDNFDASDFHGVSATSSLSNIQGWTELTEHTLRITLDDSGSTIIDVDLSALGTIQELLDLLNSLDDRDSGALSASFDQANAALEISGLASLTVAGTSTLILDVLGLNSNAVSAAVLNGVSLSLLAGLQLTSQKGNGGADVLIGSKGNDSFDLGLGAGSVTGGLGINTLTASTTATHTTLQLGHSQLLFKGAADVSASFSSINTVTLVASTGAVLLDASSVTAALDVVLDVGTTTAALKSGLGSNQLKVDITGRSTAISATVLDAAQNNEVVFYGGTTELTSADFTWVTVTGSNYEFSRNSSSDLTINSELSLGATNLSIKTDATLTINANIITDSNSAKAGNISLQAKDIVVADGVTLSAQGLTLATSGDITLLAIDDSDEITGIGFYNSDINSASIIVNAATIQGKDVTIYAVAESDPLTPVSQRGGALNAAQDFGSSVVDTLDKQSLIAGYANANVTATVNIAAGAVIEGDNISIKAKAIARVNANPTSIAIVVAIGNLKSTADVQVHGTLIAENDIEIISQTSNYLNVQARPLFGFDTAIKGYAASVAVGILDSTNNAIASDTANIIAKGDFTLQARTFDYAYVLAESDAGVSGKLATGVAVHLEKGHTTATLSGKALVQGDVTVQAVQIQGDVEGNSGTEASGVVNRVPTIIGKYWDKAKQGIAGQASSIPFVSKMLQPGDRNKPTKFTAGIAFAYVNDINNVSAYIGEVGKNTDIQVAGSLDLLASADARLLSSATSESLTPSQASQTGVDAAAYKQVPFGGAVAVVISSLDNNVISQVQGSTQLDVLGTLKIDSLAQNLTGLIDKDTTINYVNPTLISGSQISQSYAMQKDDLIRFDTTDYDWQQTVASEEPELSSYWLGAVYKFIGDDDNDVFLNIEDFSNLTRWELLGDMITSQPSILFGGVSDLYLIDNQSSAKAAGAKFSMALNATILNSKQTALTKVLSGAEINQRDTLSNSFTASASKLDSAATSLLNFTPVVQNRNLSLSSETINKSIDYTANRTSTKSFLTPKVINDAKGSTESLNGVGAGVVINTVTADSQVIIESGTDIRANSISLNADSEIFGVNIGYASGAGIGNLGIAGLYMHNTINSTTIAQIQSGANIVASKVNNPAAAVGLNVKANNRVDFISLAGGSGSGASVGVGASATVTDITKVTKALIGSPELSTAKSGTVNVDGDVVVEAKSEGFLISAAVSSAWATGKKAASGETTPETTNTNYGISGAGAFVYHKANYTTLASVSNLQSLSANKLSVTGYEGGGVYSFPIAYASAETNKFALAAAGVVLINDVDITLGAGVAQITTLTLSQLSIDATNDSTILTTSLSLGMASIAQTSASTNSSSVALTGNVSVNNVTNNIDAYLNDINSITVSGANSSGIGASIVASDQSEIYTIAAGVAYAGNGAVGVTYAENNITSDTDALIGSVNLSMTTGSVKLTADSEADILAIAIGASIVADTTPGFDTKVGLSVAAAISTNIVRANTRAKTNNSTITLPNGNDSLDINAINNSDIVAIVVAASVGLQSGGTTSVSLSGAGASVSNSVYGDTQALLTNSSIGQQTGTPVANTNVSLKAEVTGKVVANVFGASIALAAGTTGTGVAGSIGVSLATNNLGKDPDNSNAANKISAFITDTNIDVSGAVSSIAKSTQTIIANVVAVSVGLAKSETGSAGALTGVGASTTNNIKVDVSSVVSSTSTRKSLLAGSLNIYAEDTSKISAVVVGASIAGSYSPTGTSFTLSIAVSLAENNIDNNLNASLDNMQLGSSTARAAAVTVKAKSDTTITATSVAVSVAAALGSNGASVSLSGGGADAHNNVTGSTAASVIDSAIYSSAAVNINAANTSTINAKVAAVALAVSVGDPAIGVAIGAAVSRNDIGTSSSRYGLSAYLQDSSVDTSGALTVSSINTMTIDAGVGAGAMAIASSTGAGISGAGSGVSTVNNINADISAVVMAPSGAKSILASSLNIYAEDTSKITAVGVGASIAGSYAASDPSVALAIGVSLSENNIDNNLNASLNNILLGSSSARTAAVSVKAKSDVTIKATSVAASLAVALGSSGLSLSLSGGGADAHNNLTGTTSASVIDSVIYSSAAVKVKAENDSTINATVAAVALAVSVGNPAIGVAIGAAISRNDIGTSSSRYGLSAYLQDSIVDTSGALTVSSINTMTIDAGVGAGAMAIAGSTGAGISGAGTGVSVVNNINADISAVVKSTTTAKSILASSLNIYVEDTSKITAMGLGVSIAGSFAPSDPSVALAIGVSLSENNIDNNLSASLNNILLGSLNQRTAAVTIKAKSDATVNATSVAASLAVALGSSGLSLSLAGGGADAHNNLSGTTSATVIDSVIYSSAAVNINAENDSTIDATVIAVAAAVSVGDPAIGISIGAAVSHNDIGESSSRFGIESYLQNSSIDSTGVLIISATNDMTITAGVGAGALAVALSSGVGVSGAGSGVNTTNNIYAKTAAYVNNSTDTSKVISTTSVAISAVNTATINATAGSASLALAVGDTGVGVSVAASLAYNTIDSLVEAKVYGVQGSSAQIITDSVSVLAQDTSTITAKVIGVSVGAGFGTTGIAVSVAAVEAENNVSNQIDALVSGIEVQTRNGGLSVSAIEDATVTLNAEAVAVAIAAGKIGVAISGAGVGGTNKIENQVKAIITGSSITTAQRYDHLATEDSAVLSSGDLVEFSDGVYRYTGSELDYSADFMADGYAYDANGARVGAEHIQVLSNEKLRYFDGNTYQYNGSTAISLDAANAQLAVGSLANWTLLPSSVDFAALKSANAAAWSMIYATADYVAQDVAVLARNDVSIIANVGAASVSIGGGAAGGAGAVGVTLLKNTVGDGATNDSHQTQASISSSSINALNDVKVQAYSDASISSTVYGASVAVSGGKFSFSGAGVGIKLTNTIEGSTLAYVQSSDVLAGHDLLINADAIGKVTKAEGNATAVAVAISIGGALSIGVTTIENTIAMDVDSYLNLNSSTTLGTSSFQVFAANNLDVTSKADASFKNVKATAVTVSAGLVGASGGGVDIYNKVDNAIDAKVKGSGAALVGGKLSVKGDETTELNIKVTNVAISVSIGASVGVALVRNDVKSRVNARINNASITAANIDLLATANNQIKETEAVGFSASLGTAAANRADVDITTIVEATTDAANLSASDTVKINATSTNKARAQSSGGAAGGIAIGAMIADIEQGVDGTNEVLVQVGDNSVINADKLLMTASGVDDILAKSVAGAGGLVAAVGSQSNVTSYQAVVANVGKGVTINVTSLDVSSTLNQEIDASADAYSIGLLAGTGAGLDINVKTFADINLGASTNSTSPGSSATVINAHDMKVNAFNSFDKSMYANGKNLQSGSASIASVSALYSTTSIDNKATVNLTDGIQLIANGTYDDKGSIYIEAINDIKAVDNISLETLSLAGGINVAISTITADSESKVNLNNALIENVTGDVYITAKTDSENRASADILAISGLQSASGGGADVDTNATNTIDISNANIKVGDLYLYAGKSRTGVLNILESSSNVEITSVSTSVSITVPNPQADIVEVNKISLGVNVEIKAMRDVTVEAREGIGWGDRAQESGLTLSISGVPYGFEVDRDGEVSSTNSFTVDASANIIAGVNNKTFLQVRPVEEVQSILDSHVDASGVIDIAALSTVQKELLFGVPDKDGVVQVPELPADVVYVMQALDVAAIKFKMTTGTVIKDGANYYAYTPVDSVEIDLLTENYNNPSRWVDITLLGNAYIEAQYSVYDSTVTSSLTTAMTDQFYVVKPQELDAPVLTFTNLGTILFEQKAQVKSWMISHSTNAEAIARYQVQMAQINAKIDDLGLSDLVHKLEIGQVIKAQDGSFYASKIKQESILELADFQNTELWTAVGSTSNYWNYDDTVHADSKVYNRELDMLMVDLPNVYASPGSVYIQIDGKSADSLAAQSNMQNIQARAGATIQVVNSTPFSLRVNDLIIQDAQRVENVGGVLKTYTPGAVQFNYKDVNSVAVRAGVTHTNGSDLSNAQVEEVNEIVLFQDTKSIRSSYGDFTLPPIPQNMYIQGNIVNENGSAYINNKDGSIEVSTQIRAETINLFAAGDFSLNSEAWYHTNKDPRQYVNYTALRSAVYSSSLGYLNYSLSDLPDMQAAIDSDNSQILSMGKITITARHLNINGLIQSGVNTVYLKVDANFYGGRNDVELANIKGQAIAGISFANPNDSSNVKVPVNGYWDASRRAIVVEDIVPTGGEVVLSGQIISTGNGRIVAASGYASVNIENHSLYELIINDIDTRKYRQGTVTIIDSATLTKDVYQHGGSVATHTAYQGTLVVGNAATGEISKIDYAQVGNVTTQSSSSDFQYQVSEGTRYVWTEGQGKTQTEIRKYEKKSFNLFGDNALADWLVKDNSYKWKTVEFTDKKPLLESESIVADATTAPEYKITYLQTAGDTSVNDIDTDSWTTGGGWLRKKTVHTKVTIIEGLKDYYTHSLKADHSIAVSFLSGNADANVDIVSFGNITLAGRITLPDQGALSVNSILGTVTMSDGVYALTREADIRARGDINVVLEGNFQDRGHTIISSNGSINLGVVKDDNPGVNQVSSNKLYIDQVYAKYDVNINAGGGIYEATSSTTTDITGNNINLSALGGSIGHLSIDSAITTSSGTVTVVALGNVALTEVSGDMNVASIIGAQEVNNSVVNYGIQLATLDGSILDANTDTAKAAALDTENAQYFYAQSHIVNQATNNTADYHQYWQGLRTDASGVVEAYNSDVTQYANYDSLFSHLSGAELTAAQESVAQLNATYAADTEYDQNYNKLALLQVEDSNPISSTSSQFKRDVLAQKAINKPLFDSILSPGIVAKLYPGTVIIGGAGASTAEVANIQSLAAGSKITLTALQGGLGKVGESVVIDMSAGVNALSDADKQLLSAATGNDVVSTEYLFYRYMDNDATVSQFDINYGNATWEGVSGIKVTDTTGTQSLVNGAYVEVPQDGVPVLFQYTGAGENIDLSAEDFEASGAPWVRIDSQSVAPAQNLELKRYDIVMQLQTVTLQLWDDLNLAGAASLTATASAGIAIEQSGDLVVDQVTGASWVRLNASGSIIDNSSGSSAVISGSDLVLIARGDIQAADGSAFKLQLVNTASLSVDTSGLANLWQVEGAATIGGSSYQIADLNIADVAAVGSVTIGAGQLNSATSGQAPSGSASVIVQKISSSADVSLIAAADICDAFTDLTNAIINIRSVNLQLLAGGKIGNSTATSPNYLDFKISGAASANAGNDVYLNAVESHLMVGNIESAKDVYLKASKSILDSESDNNFQDISLTGNTDIKAVSIHLNALKGGIGQFGNQLEIDTDAANAGVLNSYSYLDTYLSETSGDLKLGNLVADSDNSGAADADIYIVAAASVINGASSGVNIRADKVRIIAADSIGNGAVISSQINNLEAQAVVGSIDWLNTGHLQLGTVTDLLTGVSAAGNITITANSPLTVLEHVFSASGNISLTATDSAAAATDVLTFASTSTVEAKLGAVTLNAGDVMLLEQGAKLIAKTTLVLNTDIGTVDSEAATVNLHGQLTGAQIQINTGTGDDQVLMDVQQLTGDTFVRTGAGDDRITINKLHSRSEKLQLDGESGTDSYIVNRTAADANYVIDVVDSGSAASGADKLTINGTAAVDNFLLRANFVAAMHQDGSDGYTANVERINYDSNINARLTINGHDGNDNFFSDDNSSITTLDGGAGDDSFQIGQLFADDRLSSLGNVAIGDEIETTETTLGFLSKGNTFPMVIYGGDGEDQVRVYSNKATTKLYGEDGNDSFVIRAFLKKGSQLTAGGGDVELFGGDGDDSIQYSINSPLSIDGGNGTDTVVVLGTEADDSFMITDKGIFGAGLNVGFTGVELAEVDGLEGDDTFYVLSTNANMITTIIGGLGADTFNIAGDVTTPIVSYSIEGRSSFINHSVASADGAYNGIFVNGLALNVADSSNGAVKIDAVDGQLEVDEDGLVDSYQISMDVAQPTVATLAFITVSAARASSSDKSLAHGGIAADSVLVSIDDINFYESLVISVDSASNWADTHTVYVRAVNDTAAEGLRDYVISHSVSSDNPDFDRLNIANIEVTVNDNDKADLIVTSSVNPLAVEAGVSQTFNVRLATQPAVGETVTVALAEIIPAGLTGQVSLNKTSLVFDDANWDQLQNFIVSALDDTAVENLYQANVSLSTSSNQVTDYQSLADVQVNLTVVDNDTGAVIVAATDGSTVVSSSNTDDYSLSLSKKPTAPVTISLLNDQQVIVTSIDPRFNSVDNTVTFGVDDGDWDKAIVLIVSPNPSYQHDQDKQPVQKAVLQPHTLDNIRGKLVIDGGVPADKQRSLISAVMLPTELDGELIIESLGTDESQQTDRLYMFNDGSVQDHVDGILTATSITGLGMGVGQGVEYTNIEVLETYLGTGNDEFEVAGTAAGSISVIHGGGGNDTLTVTGSDSDSALILLGDSVQDGSSYNATSLQKTAFAREFNNPGNDIIDASGAGGSVVIFGGLGDDRLTGSEFGDHIAGGSGEDTIFGLGGNDHIYGDSGINLDLSVRLDLSTQVLHIVNTADAANDNPETADNLVVSRDIIDGGAGNDIILADKGIITQLANTNRILTTAAVINITNTNRDTGGDDTIFGGSGNDLIIGGLGRDTIAGDSGNDLIIGDHGSFELLNDVVTKAYSSDIDSGNIDDLSGNSGNDTLIGGFAADILSGGAGDDTVIGDNGQVEYVDGIRRKAFSTDLNGSTGGNDTISLGTGEDQAIGGVGADRITNTAGETLIIGDDGEIFSDASGRYLLARTGNTGIGGADNITGGSDRDIIFGGFGADRLDGAAGDDIIGGDGSQITRNPNNIIFETIDLFVGGDDTLLGGAGLDRMMGAFGSDLFYADFREDILLGEYGRFTFASNPVGGEQATFIISLAQGGLDLIRQTQTELFENFAQQVFEQSDLGAVARGRTAIATQFSQDADAALGRLNLRTIQHGGQTAVQLQPGGVDFVIPTAPTAAGIESTEGQVGEEELLYDEDGFLIQPDAQATEVVEGAEAVDSEAVNNPESAEEIQCVEIEGEPACEAPATTDQAEQPENQQPGDKQQDAAELERALQKLQNSAAANDTSSINLQATLASFSGWALMGVNKSEKAKRKAS
ncbi:MAG: LEPR-XLL domain-containing protein [Pseudomonadales bacterium]|nr:LEPR-XLL domain-containing protein [Pseudomonadales bacterium]NRA17371.1 LEPR-XLL domain-containing protein [Oceanospirillaceae bacterium]